MTEEKKPNRIKEWLNNKEDKSQSISKELFSSDDVETRTELNDKAILTFSKLMFNDNFVKIRKLYDVEEETPFSIYAKQFMKLKISRNRASRGEFVTSVREDSLDKGEGESKLSRDKMNK